MTTKDNSSLSASIDNSSLSRIVKTDDALEEFFKILECNEIHLSIPSDSLMEMANGHWVHDAAKQQGASYRLKRFVELTKKFYGEDKILLNEMPQKILRNEIENPDVRHQSVGCVRGDHIALFDVERHEQIHFNVLDAHASRNEAKAAAKKKDDQVKASKCISSDEAEKYLISFKTIQAQPQWRDFLHSQYIKWIFGENVSFDTFNKILNDTNCASVSVFINLLLIHHLTIFLDKTNCREDLRPLVEIEENSRPDILIASMAAYSDYFICDDSCLMARCNFLKKLEMIKFETVTLNEFKIRCKGHVRV